MRDFLGREPSEPSWGLLPQRSPDDACDCCGARRGTVDWDGDLLCDDCADYFAGQHNG